jgi:hypothetical protein
MAAGTFRPTLLAAAAARARARRVLDFRHALPPGLVSGYDMAGLSTFVDAAGVVRYQPHNLFWPNNDLSHSNWNNSAQGITRFADRIEETATTDQHRLGFSLAGQQQLRRRVQFKAKPFGDRPVIQAWAWLDGIGYTQWNHTTGVVTQQLTGDTPPATVSGLDSEGYRTYEVSIPALSVNNFVIRAVPTGTLPDGSYLGATGNGLHVKNLRLVYGDTVPDSTPDTTTAVRHLPAMFDNGRRGLRLEGSRPNRSTNTETFSGWTVQGATLTQNFGVAPNGDLASDRLQITANTGNNLSRNYTPTPGERVVGSCWVRGTAGQQVYYSANTSGPASNATLITFTGSWQRVTSNVSVGTGSTSFEGFEIWNRSGGAALPPVTFEVWGQQQEPSEVASSYIPNPTGAEVLRPGAQQVITGAEFDRLFPAARTRGPELVVNGGFNVDANWTKGTGWTIGSGVAAASVVSNDGAQQLTQSFATIPGRQYVVTYTASGVSGTGFSIFHGGASPPGNAGAFRNSAGTFTETIVASGSTLFLSFGARGSGPCSFSIDNVSVREFDLGVPSLQAFTLFVTLADRPRPFGFTEVFAIFALNNSGNYTTGAGLLIRDGSGFASAGGNSSAVNNGTWVNGRNVIAMTVDVANRRLALSLNAAAPGFITNLDYTGVGSTRMQLRAIDAFNGQGNGAVIHQSLEVLPLMSDAALQAECARRFALP